MLTIRSAKVEDVPGLFEMVRELAEAEQSLDKVVITQADLARDGFGPAPKFQAILASWSGEPAGYAIFFDCYSSWRGPQIFLEDLYVRPAFRKKGIATSLMARVAKVATERNCRAVRWEVLEWNQPAVNLYASLGAVLLNDYRIALLKGDALRDLAARIG